MGKDWEIEYMYLKDVRLNYDWTHPKFLVDWLLESNFHVLLCQGIHKILRWQPLIAGFAQHDWWNGRHNDIFNCLIYSLTPFYSLSFNKLNFKNTVCNNSIDSINKWNQSVRYGYWISFTLYLSLLMFLLINSHIWRLI